MQHTKKNFIYVIRLFLILQFFIPQVVFGEVQRVVFILDASASMWGQINGRPKIDIAKEIMKELLAKSSENMDIRLMVYGHRRKGDCKDIEMIESTGTNTEELQATIDKIMPRGMTPITNALKIASSNISSGTVVLISDGIETCKGDPCALAKEFRENGVKIVIYTVGFGVDEKAAKQLTCIAEATGGHYYPARDSKRLRDILFAVKNAVAQRETPPPPKITAELIDESGLKHKTKRLKLTAFGKIVLRPADWVKMPPYRWGVVDAETGQPRGEGGTSGLRVKNGEYQIWWQQTEHHNSKVLLSNVVRVNGGVAEVPIDTGVRISVPGDIPVPYEWWLVRAGTKDVVAEFYDTLDPQVVPFGTYELHWWQEEHHSIPINLGNIKIDFGKLNECVIDQGFLLKVSTNESLYYYRLVGSDGRVVGEWSGRPSLQIAPSGTYTLYFRQTEHGHSDVRWGQVVIPEKGFPVIKIDSGVKFIADSNTPFPYRVYFKNLEDGQEIIWKGDFARSWSPIFLPPGRYRLDWWEKEHETTRTTLIDEFTVEPSTILEVEL